MPIIHIHKITVTPSKAINYAKSDKVESLSIDGEQDIADVINYAKSDKTGEVIYKTFTSYHNSVGLDFNKECLNLLEKFPRKREVREGEEPALLFHLIQGFEGFIPPQLANQIGMEFAKEAFPNYICQVSTHTNTENIHNHIVFCAVSLDGERYNDCDESYARLREISDRISEKYGLRILENTREYKPIHWVDENGNRHSYEPTQRKNDMIHKRENGEISTDDVSSYRNFSQYEESQTKAKTQKEIVKSDIDDCLKIATSYENLLSLLRENYGYSIKDKKKNGEYLQHILFIPPTYSKGVRDNSLSDDGYYERENLERVINENAKNRSEQVIEEMKIDTDRDETIKADSNIPLYDDFSYNKFNLSSLDENLRAWRKGDGSVIIIKRGEPEKSVIREAKQIESDSISKLNSYGYEAWQSDYIMHHAFEPRTAERFSMQSEHIKFSQSRHNDIQDRLNCLHFLEDNNLTNYNRISSVMNQFWENYNSCYDKLNDVGERLDKMRFLANMPILMEQIKRRIAENKDNAEYRENELSLDTELLRKYESYLQARGLLDNPSKISKLNEDIQQWEKKYLSLSDLLAKRKSQLVEYERSIDILRNSSKGTQEIYREVWVSYDSDLRKNAEKEKKNDETRKKRENRNPHSDR